MSLRTAGILGCLSLLFLAAEAQSKDSSFGITAYRAKMMAQGWKPRETFGIDADGVRWSQFGDAGEMYRAGLVEVESCSGTGSNFCIFNYSKGKKCLAVTTQGEFKKGAYEPIVIDIKRRCPYPAALRHE